MTSLRIKTLKYPPGFDLTTQILPVPGTAQPGQTPHFRNAAFPDLLTVESDPLGPKTGHELFLVGLAFDGGRRNCVAGRRRDPASGQWSAGLTYLTYGQVAERRDCIGSAISHLLADGTIVRKSSSQSGGGGGGDPTKLVGLLSVNRPDWPIIDLACMAYSRALVPLYETLGPNAVEFIIDHAELAIVFVANDKIAPILTLRGRRKINSLCVIVSMDDLGPNSAFKSWGKSVGITVLSLNELVAIGAKNKYPHVPPKPEDLFTISYTSGTTGNPKGVMLSHKSMVSAILSQTLDLEQFSHPKGLQVASFLPLAHIFERFTDHLHLGWGNCVGYCTGEPLRLLEDLQIIKPYGMVCVPRVYNRLFAAIQAKMADTGLKSALLRRAISVKLDNYHRTGTVHHAFYDRIVLKPVRELLGGNMSLLVSGSAPISKEVSVFMRVAFSVDFVEGMGMTETVAAGNKTISADFTAAGTCGPPQSSLEIKLVDVPAMKYFSTDKNPRGEICYRGQPIFSGYYKDDTKTKEVLRADGWLHTGDVGEIDSVGRLKIIDRTKNIVKLSQGEYIAVESVESTYGLYSTIAQIFVHADSLQDSVVAIVVVDPVAFAALVSSIKHTNVASSDTEKLRAYCQDPEVRKAFLAEMTQSGRKNGLNGVQIVRNIHLTIDPFTIEQDLMTPTMKLKRPQLKEFFKETLIALYK